MNLEVIMGRLFAAVAAACLLAGCATKQYGAALPLSDLERTSLSCREIELERSRVDAFRAQMASTWSTTSLSDWVPWNFGIGNAIEYNRASESADRREAELKAAAAARGCAE